jgi:hypothetical protein
VSAFFKNRDVGSGAMGLKEALRIVKGSMEWRQKYEKIIADWLDKHVPDEL